MASDVFWLGDSQLSSSLTRWADGWESPPPLMPEVKRVASGRRADATSNAFSSMCLGLLGQTEQPQALRGDLGCFQEADSNDSDGQDVLI